MTQSSLFINSEGPGAKMSPLRVYADENRWYELGEAIFKSLGDLDVILMRKDPPFDSEFIYSTYILEAAERLGTLIVNKPQSLRDCNEKYSPLSFHNVLRRCLSVVMRAY